MARVDRLGFYNSYAVYRENTGKKQVNPQDPRYGFRAQMVLAMREYARRAMVAGVSKNGRTKEIDRKRSVVTSIIIKLFNFDMLREFELSCIPLVESEVAAGWHKFETAGLQGCMQASCIIPSCRSRPTTFCQGCTRDVQGIVFVCSPKRGKRCWKYFIRLVLERLWMLREIQLNHQVL